MPHESTPVATARSHLFAGQHEASKAALVDCGPRSALRGGFTGTITECMLGEFSLARIDSQRPSARWTERDVARSPRAGYYANFQVRGTGLIRQGGRIASLSPGDMVLLDADQPFDLEFGTSFQQLSLFIPRRLLDSQTSGSVCTATRVGTAAGVGAAVRHIVLALSRRGLTAVPAARLAALASGMLAVAMDLVAADLMAADPVAAPVAGTRADRSYAAALADIEEHLTEPDLCPAATGRRLGISVRLVHGLFAGREHTYAGTVRRLRLELAMRDLHDPARGHLRVIDIATDAGFGNVASFHRAFRREFGQTPARVRSGAGKPVPAPRYGG